MFYFPQLLPLHSRSQEVLEPNHQETMTPFDFSTQPFASYEFLIFARTVAPVGDIRGMSK